MAGSFINLKLVYLQGGVTKIGYSVFALWLLLFAAGANDMAYADGGNNPALTKTWTLRSHLLRWLSIGCLTDLPLG